MATTLSPTHTDLVPNYSTNNLFVRSGYLYLSNVTGLGWKLRYAVLTQDFLSFQVSETSRNSRYELPLSIITKLERTMLKPHSLSIQIHDHHVKSRTVDLAFVSDDELYGWMDAIHAHSPFGCGNPFGFKHKVQVGFGPNGFTGLPQQWETIQSRFPGTLSPTSPVKKDVPLPETPEPYKFPAPGSAPAHPQETPPHRSPLNRFSTGESIEAEKTKNKSRNVSRIGAEGDVLLQGKFKLKESGSWNAWVWWKRYLILTTEMLVVLKGSGMGKPQTSKLKINLQAITAISRSKLGMYCLLVETTMDRKNLMISFESDKELYDWQDAIYLHSSLSGIGYPQDLVHRVHVQFNPHRGKYTGLPRQWKSQLKGTRVRDMIDAHDTYKSGSNPSPPSRSRPENVDILGLIDEYKDQRENQGQVKRRRRIQSRAKAPHSFSSSISTVVGDER
jgi:hypothetical protein